MQIRTFYNKKFRFGLFPLYNSNPLQHFELSSRKYKDWQVKVMSYHTCSKCCTDPTIIVTP